jgi:transcriptional regulator with XRE-family HTH domain
VSVPEISGAVALRIMLDAIGVSQAGFAQDVGISAKHLNQLLQGKANFTPETTALIADGLAVRLMAIDTAYRLRALRKAKT